VGGDQGDDEDGNARFHELKLTGGIKKPKKPKTEPTQNETDIVKRIYFVVNDGFVHGVYSEVWRVFTNGSNLEPVIGDEFIETGLIATAVAIQPSIDDTSSGYLYVATSRTVYAHSTAGCIIYRLPLDSVTNDSTRETVVSISGSKILALALDSVSVSYTDAPVDSSMGWYWYVLIGFGGLLVLALARMAVLDVIKLIKGDISPSNPAGEGERRDGGGDQQETYKHYYPPASQSPQPSPYPSPYQPLGDSPVSPTPGSGTGIWPSTHTSLNQQ
jgi:hypothetical protein